MTTTYNIGDKCKVYFPDKSSDIYNVYLGQIIGQHVENGYDNLCYHVISIPANGKCINVHLDEESDRLEVL